MANATLTLSGDQRKPATFEGKGTLELVNAKLAPLSVIQQIGAIMGVDELQMLRLKTAKANILIHDNKVEIVDATMQSANLILSGSGPIRLDNGRMKIAAQLKVNRKLQQQLKSVLSDNFVDTADPEYKQLDFKITGTAAKPKSDLLEKLSGIKMGSEIGGILNMFHLPSAPAPDKKQEE